MFAGLFAACGPTKRSTAGEPQCGSECGSEPHVYWLSCWFPYNGCLPVDLAKRSTKVNRHVPQAACLLAFSLLAAPQKGQPQENRSVAPSVAPSRMFTGFLAGFPITVACRLTWPKGQPKSTGMCLKPHVCWPFRCLRPHKKVNRRRTAVWLRVWLRAACLLAFLLVSL